MKRVIEISRQDVYKLSADTGLDPRTIKRAVERGIDKMQAEVDRTKLREAAARLKIRVE